MLILMTFLGCAMGWVVRYLGMTLVSRVVGERFPWGTLAVNALGSLLLGIVLGGGLFASGGLQAFLGIGFCGGLTTFSTFSLQTLSLASEQSWGKALVNILGSVLICLLSLLSGYALGEVWAR